MPAMEDTSPHQLARDLRPQEFGKTRPTTISDALIEPAWPGPRVIAAVGGGRATLWSAGESMDEHTAVAAALGHAIGRTTVDGAIFEGYLTKQGPDEGVGVRTWQNQYPTVSGTMTRMFIGGRRNRLQEYEDRKEAEAAASVFEDDDVISLVVVDLLWLDGQWLLDVPLLERKRVLESIVPSEPLIRPGPYVRQPIASWIGSWRAQGFRGMTFKAANSRYRPGETSDEWTLADMPRR
jgi:hypothetical protein